MTCPKIELRGPLQLQKSLLGELRFIYVLFSNGLIIMLFIHSRANPGFVESKLFNLGWGLFFKGHKITNINLSIKGNIYLE